jgi:hypothetical protein
VSHPRSPSRTAKAWAPPFEKNWRIPWLALLAAEHTDRPVERAAPEVVDEGGDRRGAGRIAGAPVSDPRPARRRSPRSRARR